MARQRDETYESVARLYMAHLRLATQGTLGFVEVEGEVVPVDRDMLDADWSFSALEQAGTPITRAIELQRFVALVQTYSALGVPSLVLLKHLVKLADAPKEFVDAAMQAQAQAQAQAQVPVPDPALVGEEAP